MQFLPPHPISLRSILILSSHLRLGLPSGLFPSDFPTRILYSFLFSPCVLHAPPISSSLTCNSNYSWKTVQVMKLIMQFSPASYQFILRIIIYLLYSYSLIGIATGYGLDGRRIGVRFPIGARHFSFLHTGSRAHPEAPSPGVEL
jgi:hypothetical protein